MVTRTGGGGVGEETVEGEHAVEEDPKISDGEEETSMVEPCRVGRGGGDGSRGEGGRVGGGGCGGEGGGFGEGSGGCRGEGGGCGGEGGGESGESEGQ